MNSRWIPPPLGDELLKQMAYIPFFFRPKPLSVAGFKDIKSRSSNAFLQSASRSGRGSSWSRLDPWGAELLPLPLTYRSSTLVILRNTSFPSGEQRTFQQPLHLMHQQGWLKPSLLPRKFMITSHSYFFPWTERPSNSAHIRWPHQRPASSSPFYHGKQVALCCPEFSPTQGSSAGWSHQTSCLFTMAWDMGAQVS